MKKAIAIIVWGLLWCNAGIAGEQAAVEDLDIDAWDTTFKVNVYAAFCAIKLVTPLMKAQQSGSIINISTKSSQVGLPNRLPYIASKSAINGLTYNLARELGPYNIRCNAIMPGLVDNERGRMIVARMAKEAGVSEEEFKSGALKYISMRTEVQPSEIADMASFLASEQAKHVTGQLIAVDGNMEWEG